jgi:hypothetical protein
MNTQTTQTYAEWLEKLIIAYKEDIINYKDCYLCNFIELSNKPILKNNDSYLKRFQASIKKKIRSNNYYTKEYTRNGLGTLTFVLMNQYPNLDKYQRRIAWIEDLIKYHRARGTCYCFQETRNWMKL